MKLRFVIAFLLAGASSAGFAAKSDKDAVRELVAAIKKGADLAARYPNAISSGEIASLRSLAACRSHSPMKQQPGRFTVVWECRKSGAHGMEVLVREREVTSVSTFGVERRPN